MNAKSFSLRLLKKEQVAFDTFSFYFDRENIDYNFLPGQYNRVTLPIHVTDGRGQSRFFTISSSPLEKDFLTITTKLGASDFKKAFFALEKGAMVQFFGPIGGFVLLDDEVFEHVFLAGGIGITPFHSMTAYIAKKNLPIPVTLFVSFSTPEEKVFYDELSKIASERNNIRVIYTITKPQESKEKWTGETGRISETLIKKYVTDISKPTYYIIGPPKMVDGTEEMLEKMGITEGKIKVEQFSGY